MGAYLGYRTYRHKCGLQHRPTFFLSVDVCCFAAAERVVFRRYREIPQLIGGWFTSGKRTLACVYLICASQRFEPLGLRPGIPFR